MEKLIPWQEWRDGMSYDMEMWRLAYMGMLFVCYTFSLVIFQLDLIGRFYKPTNMFFTKDK